MRTLFLFIFSVSQWCFAQKIEVVNSLFPIDKEGVFFEHVNASLYMPPTYSKVEHFIYEDEKAIENNDGTITVPYLSQEIRSQRQEIHPIRKFDSHVYFKKGNIFIGCHFSWITLSSFYSFSNGNITVDEQTKLHRERFINAPERHRNENTFTQLEKLNSELVNSVNADDVYIYKSSYVFSYNSKEPNYGSIVVNLLKYDLGRISLVYYYPLNEYKKVLEEVDKTWGVVRFKKDSEFIPPKRKYDSKPELYFGKFSYLNNLDQELEERESYLKRIGGRK